MKKLSLIIAAILLMMPAWQVDAARKKAEDSPMEKLLDSYKNIDGAHDFAIRGFLLGAAEMFANMSGEQAIAAMIDVVESVRIFGMMTEDGDKILSEQAGHEPTEDSEQFSTESNVSRFISAAGSILPEHYQLMSSETDEPGTVEKIYYSDAFAEMIVYKIDAESASLANVFLIKFDTKKLKLQKSTELLDMQMKDSPMNKVLTSCKDISGVDDFTLKGLLFSVVQHIMTVSDDIAPELDMKDVSAFFAEIHSLRFFSAATKTGVELLESEENSTASQTDSTAVGKPERKSVSDADMESLVSELEDVLSEHYRRTTSVIKGYGVVSESYGKDFSFADTPSGICLFVKKSLAETPVVEIIMVDILNESGKIESVDVGVIYVDADHSTIIDAELFENGLAANSMIM